MSQTRSDNPIFLASGNPEAEDELTLAQPGMLGHYFTVRQPFRGTRGVEEVRDKSYQLIQTDSSMAVAPYKGALAWWSNQQNFLVTTDPTVLGRNRIAGVFQNAITAGRYGCIQKAGPATVKFIDAVTQAPSDDGHQVIPSATAGKADAIAAGTATGWTVIGKTVSTLVGGLSEAVVELEIHDSNI